MSVCKASTPLPPSCHQYSHGKDKTHFYDNNKFSFLISVKPKALQIHEGTFNIQKPHFLSTR